MKVLPKTDQQLMSLAWGEQQQGGATSPIFSHTRRLLHIGLVERCDDTLSVRLTEAGRQRAAQLAETPEGRAYLAWGEQEDTDGKPFPG
ncbi:hypothetical protein [Deinococcus humi]|uniref:Uncharacterized protein n=1 Tax=Deinococcus humi TaxID=662880 RepID=A0A7W8NE00_9DEIO|nr:hypothetical protein [Deinococcus humi]MBB5361288.1 hypothetical protein [Deinococcus humi]GGO19324.1 hypothetical protein GCM10008949_03540 [Deinococcus humi]